MLAIFLFFFFDFLVFMYFCTSLLGNFLCFVIPRFLFFNNFIFQYEFPHFRQSGFAYFSVAHFFSLIITPGSEFIESTVI